MPARPTTSAVGRPHRLVGGYSQSDRSPPVVTAENCKRRRRRSPLRQHSGNDPPRESLTDGRPRAVMLSVSRLHATPKDTYEFLRERKNQLNKYRSNPTAATDAATSHESLSAAAAEVGAVDVSVAAHPRPWLIGVGAVPYNRPSASTDWPSFMGVLSQPYCVVTNMKGQYRKTTVDWQRTIVYTLCSKKVTPKFKLL